MEDYEQSNAKEWDLSPEKQANQAHKHATPPNASNETTPAGQFKALQSGPAKGLAPTGKPRTAPQGPAGNPHHKKQTPNKKHQTSTHHPTARERRSALPIRPAWQVAEGVRRREEAALQGLPALHTGHAVENSAEIAWRNQHRPAATILIPKELAWREEEYERHAREFGTFVFSLEYVAKENSFKIGIWGEPSAVEHTRRKIYDWAAREALSKRARGDAPIHKNSSLLPHQRQAEEKKWVREVRRQRFRQGPPLGTAFGAIGTFHWPLKEYQPHEVLGNSYEALDSIRMACSCYVVFEKEVPGFQVMGERNAVQDALVRIRKACFQIAARQIAPVRRYALQFADRGTEIPSHVSLESYDRIKLMGADVSAQQPGRTPQGVGEIESVATRVQMLERSARDVKIAGRTIMLMLKRLHYYRGNLRLRIHLGTFLATHYRTVDDDIYTTDDFKSMLQQSQFAGETTIELGNELAETTALRKLQSADYLLDPRSTTEEDLFQIKPIYSAVYILEDRAGDLRLEISWHEHDSGYKKANLERLSTRWFRLDRSTGSTSSLVDINILNLENSSAWHFDLSASQAVDEKRLAPGFLEFAESVKIDEAIAKSHRANVAFVTANPYVNIKALQQKTGYHFALKNSNYTLELFRFQDRTFTRRSRLPGDQTCEAYEPRWGLQVYHSIWDTLLTRNEHLPVGEMADWDDGVMTWFPEDDDMNDFGQVKGECGFEQLVAKLGLVEKLVLDSGADTVGGMQIG